jgi:AcrR family transcriptional regulator
MAPNRRRSQPSEDDRPRRRYVSPVRRQQAAETRHRIVTAGAELLHGFPVWNWRALTIAAVAERAGVHERTVYRYFANERALRDAILERFEDEAGVKLEGLELEDLQDVTTRILEYTASFPVAPRTERDATVAAANARQREALLAAMAPVTDGWSDRDRVVAASIFDVLWSIVSYERLVLDWELEPEEAINAITWAIGRMQDAVRHGERPSGSVTQDCGTTNG